MPFGIAQEKTSSARTATTDSNGMNVSYGETGTLARLLDVSAMRQSVIAQNIANVNTPGYHRLDVEFESQFQEQLKTGSYQSVSGVQPKLQQLDGLPERADRNNINIDLELGELNRNAMLYRTWLQLLGSRMQTMRAAISG